MVRCRSVVKRDGVADPGACQYELAGQNADEQYARASLIMKRQGDGRRIIAHLGRTAHAVNAGDFEQHRRTRSCR